MAAEEGTMTIIWGPAITREASIGHLSKEVSVHVFIGYRTVGCACQCVITLPCHTMQRGSARPGQAKPAYTHTHSTLITRKRLDTPPPLSLRFPHRPLLLLCFFFKESIRIYRVTASIGLWSKCKLAARRVQKRFQSLYTFCIRNVIYMYTVLT